jgi:hypothetical protein
LYIKREGDGSLKPPRAVIFLCIIVLSTWVNAETIRHEGLEITISRSTSTLEGILNFIVRAKNTTDNNKTLIATIYLFPAGSQQNITEKTPGSPVYLEIPKNQTAEDTFYLFYTESTEGTAWKFLVDEVYNFILSDNDNNEFDDICKEEGKEEGMIDIVGTWKMTTGKNSKVYGDWTWIFQKDGTVIVEEILGPEARMPMTYEGTYEIKGNKVYIDIYEGSPFPHDFEIQGDRLVSKNEVLTRTSDPSLFEP